MKLGYVIADVVSCVSHEIANPLARRGPQLTVVDRYAAASVVHLGTAGGDIDLQRARGLAVLPVQTKRVLAVGLDPERSVERGMTVTEPHELEQPFHHRAAQGRAPLPL